MLQVKTVKDLKIALEAIPDNALVKFIRPNDNALALILDDVENQLYPVDVTTYPDIVVIQLNAIDIV